MSETANVRCPKCGNLLPEVTDYSVYQCGGCGAVLKGCLVLWGSGGGGNDLSANNKVVDLDTFSEKSNCEERDEGSIEMLSDGYEKMMNISESDVRSTISSSSLAETRRMISHNRGESRRTRFTTKDEKKWDVDEAADINQHKRSVELQRAKVAQDDLEEDSEIYHEKNDNGLMRYRNEGPPKPVSKFSYDHYENPSYGFNNADYIGDDRVELLRKLDELRDHLSRSGNLVDKGKEKVPLDRRMSCQDPYVSEMNRVSMQNPYHDPLNNRPHYPNQYAEPPPLMHSRQEMPGDGFYPPRYAPAYRRGSYQAPMPYHIMPSHAYKSGPYMDDDGIMYMDATMEPYPPSFSRHHPSCSCYQCRTPIPPASYSDKYLNVPNDRIFNYHDNPTSRDYNHRFSDPRPLKSQLRPRCPGDVNSEADGFTPRCRPRVHLPSGGKICRPIAGGAPFFTCYNCFELLLLPKKVRTKDKGKKKRMSCGACSTVIVFTVSNINLVVSSDVEPEDNNYVKVDKPTNGHCHGHPNQVRTTFSPDDYDNSGYKIKSRHSTSTYTSGAEEDNESSVSKDDKGPRPPVGSSLQDHLEYSNKHRMAKRFGEGNKSGRSEMEKVISDKSDNEQISRNESLATEIDLSSNEYSNTGTTFDSGEGSREGGCLAKSFFGSINGFNDSNRSSDESFEQEKANVTVNGHLIPARLIKKAEKLAGPIQPGNYWYDFRAGFWGAIGGHCLGIIPPFIEEFNYPMHEHCAGGNTHVFVNGRELNQKDMKLLVSRGLPTERDRSYIVEISGRVLDEDTGEELVSLGKLAPTVERMKHGFGMRAPKAVA